jgi:hypothetical protein
MTATGQNHPERPDLSLITADRLIQAKIAGSTGRAVVLGTRRLASLIPECMEACAPAKLQPVNPHNPFYFNYVGAKGRHVCYIWCKVWNVIYPPGEITVGYFCHEPSGETGRRYCNDYQLSSCN